MSLLSDVVVTFLSSIVVSTPKGQFLECANIAFGEQYYWECLGKYLWVYRVMLYNLLDQVWLVKCQQTHLTVPKSYNVLCIYCVYIYI
jgi:hypothetical protein